MSIKSILLISLFGLISINILGAQDVNIYKNKIAVGDSVYNIDYFIYNSVLHDKQVESLEKYLAFRKTTGRLLITSGFGIGFSYAAFEVIKELSENTYNTDSALFYSFAVPIVGAGLVTFIPLTLVSVVVGSIYYVKMKKAKKRALKLFSKYGRGE